MFTDINIAYTRVRAKCLASMSMNCTDRDPCDVSKHIRLAVMQPLLMFTHHSEVIAFSYKLKFIFNVNNVITNYCAVLFNCVFDELFAFLVLHLCYIWRSTVHIKWISKCFLV